MKNIILFFLWACMIMLPILPTLTVLNPMFYVLAGIAAILITLNVLSYIRNEAQHNLTPDGVIVVKMISVFIVIVVVLGGIFFLTPQYAHPYFAISYWIVFISALRIPYGGVVEFIKTCTDLFLWPIKRIFGFYHRGWTLGNWNENYSAWLPCLRTWLLKPLNPFS